MFVYQKDIDIFGLGRVLDVFALLDLLYEWVTLFYTIVIGLYDLSYKRIHIGTADCIEEVRSWAAFSISLFVLRESFKFILFYIITENFSQLKEPWDKEVLGIFGLGALFTAKGTWV